MSSPTLHVAEQPDILAADAELRKELIEVVGEVTELLPNIKNVIRLARGDADDAVNIVGQTTTLMNSLFRIEACQRVVGQQLERRKADWNVAINSRSGQLGDLDGRWEMLKNNVRQLEETFWSLKEQNTHTESTLTSLRQQVSSAEATLTETQLTEASIKVNCETKKKDLDELERRLAKQEEALGDKDRELGASDAEHRASVKAFEAEEHNKTKDLNSREKVLDNRVKDFELTRTSEEEKLTKWSTALDTRSEEVQGRENAAANTEVELQQTKRSNDIGNQKLRSVLSILQSLANATGSDYNTGLTLNNIQSLAASIRTRCQTLHETSSASDKGFTDQQEHLSEVEAGLESTTKELETLRSTHENEMKKFSSLKQKAFKNGATVQQLAETRKKLADKSIEHSELLVKYADLEAQHQSYSEQLEKAKEDRDCDQAEISGLRSYLIPRQEATERVQESQIKDLIKTNKTLATSSYASDAEMRQAKIENVGLEKTVQELREQLSVAKTEYDRVENSFNTLRNAKVTEAKAGDESLQRSLQALEKSETINEALNLSLHSSNEERQSAANDISALKSEVSELRLQTSNAVLRRNESILQIRDLQLAAEETRKKIMDLESQCADADTTITSLRDEATETEQTIDDLESRIEQKDSHIQELKLAAEEIKNKVTFLESECSEQDTTITGLKEDAGLAESSSKRVITGLQADIAQKDTNIQDLHKRRQSLESDKNRMNKTINDLNEKLKGLERNLTARQKEIDTLNSSSAEDKQFLRRITLDITGINGLDDQLKTKSAIIANNEAALQLFAQEKRTLTDLRGILAQENEQLKKENATVSQSLHSTSESKQRLTEQLDLLKNEMRELRMTEIPGKDAEINALKLQAAEQREQASESQRDTRRDINRLNSEMQRKEDVIQEQSHQLRQYEQGLKELQVIADESTSEAKSAKMKLIEAQDTIESINSSDEHLRSVSNVELRAAVDKCTLEHSDIERTIEDIRTSCENIEEERDAFESQVKTLTAQLQSCQCSDTRDSRKRSFGQMASGGDEALSMDQINRSLQKAPESRSHLTATIAGPSFAVNPLEGSATPARLGSERQGNAANSSSGVHNEQRHDPNMAPDPNIGRSRQSPVLRPGTLWRIEDALDKSSTAPPIPQQILMKLRGQIRRWDRQKANWRAGSIDRLPKCAENFVSKRGTRWVDGNNRRACAHCTAHRLLCVAVANHCVEILPVDGSLDSRRDIADVNYWIN